MSAENRQLKQFIPTPPRAPAESGQRIWRRVFDRCFNSLGNSILTICVLVVAYYVIRAALDWAVFDAVWDAQNRRECLDISPDGACWAGVISWFDGLIYGRYPADQQWRVDLGVGLALLWLVPCASRKVTNRGFILLSWIGLFPFLGAYLFLGGRLGFDLGIVHSLFAAISTGFFALLYINWILAIRGHAPIGEQLYRALSMRFGHRARLINLAVMTGGCAIAGAIILAPVDLQPVGIERWGGLFLTLIIASFAITMSIPIGVVLALGRRSKLPVIHWICLALIEVVRAVPLITVLFMAVTLLPIFLPANVELNKLSQVLVAVCVFAGAYMAENIRGGLQAIPPGQFEAAQSLGLGYWMTMLLVVLPQALRLMIPNIMTSFISILKDTTLVSIIGLFDIMLMARNIANDKDWIGLHTEPIAMISVLFFVLCYGMSQYSINLEKRLKVDR